MNYLRICRYLYAKRFFNEIVLLFQLVVMLVFAFAVLNPIDDFLQKEHKIVSSYNIDFDEALHFNMGNFVFQQQSFGEGSLTDTIYGKIMETEGVGSVLQSTTCTVNYDTGKKDSDGHSVYSNALAFMYADDMIDKVNVKLSEGMVRHDAGDGIPILVSAALAKELPVGSRTDIIVSNDGKSVECIVTGILKKEEALSSINNYGSFENLSTFGVIPEQDGCNRYIIMYDLETGTDALFDLGAKFLILPENGCDRQTLKERLEKNIGDYGYIKEADEILKNSYIHMLENNAKYVLAFVMITAIAVFGYGGYLYLMIIQHQKEFGVFYILGMSRKKMISVIFISGMLLLLTAFIIASLSMHAFMEKILGIYNYETGIFSYVFCAVIMGVILLTSVFVGFGQSKKLAEVTIYNGGMEN